MPLTAREKVKYYNKHLIPIANNIRKLEGLAIDHASHRKIETVANCLHTLLNDLRKDLKLPFNESDMEPSPYGESGNPKP